MALHISRSLRGGSPGLPASILLGLLGGGPIGSLGRIEQGLIVGRGGTIRKSPPTVPPSQDDDAPYDAPDGQHQPLQRTTSNQAARVRLGSGLVLGAAVANVVPVPSALQPLHVLGPPPHALRPLVEVPAGVRPRVCGQFGENHPGFSEFSAGLRYTKTQTCTRTHTHRYVYIYIHTYIHTYIVV